MINVQASVLSNCRIESNYFSRNRYALALTSNCYQYQYDDVIAKRSHQMTSLAEVTPLRSLKSYRNRIAVEWRRIEVAPAGITEHYSLKKKQLFWFGLEPPTRRSRSKSAPKFYPNRLRFGSTRAKNLFGVKTSLWSSITRKFNSEFASIYQHIKLC